MKTVCVPVGCRSDAGLSAPIIKGLKEQDWCECQVVQLEPQQFIPSYQLMDCVCKGYRHIGNHNAKKPDLVFITGDRVEQCAAAAAAFHNQIKIAHYGAGVVNYPLTTYDDVDRHQITLWSDLQFVESEETAEVVWDLKHSVGLKSNMHLVGIPHLDDLEVDISKIPYQQVCEPNEDEERKTGFYKYDVLIPYDLVLYNTPTIGDCSKDIASIRDLISNSYSVLIGGNPDGDDADDKLSVCVDEYYPDLPRAQFFGLLKNCQRFITNSSAAIYEAPHFLKPEQIVQIGNRNYNRPRGPFQTGASDKIVEILRDYLT